jgi:murein DD-endopeptidase MepM/ murein hydrolase activator NlpD
VHIILVSNRLTTAKTIMITWRHAAGAAFGVALMVLGLSSLFSYVTVRHAADIDLPFVQELLHAATADETRASNQFVRENLNAMAVKLGQMQAQLLRLDSLGDRLAGLAGIKPQELGLSRSGKDGRGGPLLQPRSLSTDDLRVAVESLSRQVEAKSDALSLLEEQLLEERVRKNQLPTSLPIDLAWTASSFGARVDPFTGEAALHEGVDFPAEVGTSIKAAAAGVVIRAEKHPGYGNVVDIDHGNDLVTRYAHCSKLLVQPGALVKRGQPIAEVGTTGRSTGPHLHFEVRIKDIAQNPNRFLQMAQNNSALAPRN